MYPGQVELLRYDLKQMKVLASPIRSEIFYSFSDNEPMSAAEIAHECGKSPQTVHYHIGELVKAGLIIAVDERKKHARIEKLYVRSGVTCLDMGPGISEEYDALRNKGFAAQTRVFNRETEVFTKVIAHDVSKWDFNIFRMSVIHVTAEQAQEFKKRVLEALSDLVDNQSGRDQPRVHVALFMKPTIGQSRTWLKELGATAPSLSEDSEEESV